MAKRKRVESDSDKNESYLIKVPVHLAFMYEEKNSLFFSNKSGMIEFVKNKIDAYREPVVIRTRNKTKTTVISSIRYNEYNLNGTPFLLLTIGAFDTNVSGKYLEGNHNSKVDITPEHKLGSDNNVFMIYPVIKGLSTSSHTCSFLLLSYETPFKDGDDMTKLARLFIKKVLNFSGANLKPPHIIEEIKSIPKFQEVLMRFTSISHDENEVDMELREYCISGQTKKSSLKKFKDVPAQLIFDALDRKNIQLTDNRYIAQETSFIIGKHTYRIKKELADDIAEIQESAEKIFNASVTITKDEFENKINNIDFIIDKLSSVITNYLSYDDDSI